MTSYNYLAIAKDLVYTNLNQSVQHPVTLDDVMANHGLTATDLANLLNNDDFKSATRSELLRAKKLGPRAGYVFRTEDMITSLAEELYRRLMDPDATLQEFVKGFVSLARTVGMDELPDAKAPQASSTVNLQINVPRFENPKLRYLESKDSGV